MEYIDFFEQIDQDLSQQMKSLQKKQEELIEQKKIFLETKQKIHGFLSDAHEMKQLLESHPDLVELVRTELNKMFKVDSSSSNPPLNKQTNQSEKTTKVAQKKEVSQGKKEPVKLPPDNLEKQEKIEIFNFVDMDGKSTVV